MKRFVSRTLGTFTLDELPGLSLRQLTELYNEVRLVGSPLVKELRNKPLGIEKIRGVLDPTQKPRPRDTRKPFALPKKRNIRPHRPGTKQDAIIKLLSRPRGASFEECQEALKTDRAQVFGMIYRINTYLGYGISEENGRIKLVF